MADAFSNRNSDPLRRPAKPPKRPRKGDAEPTKDNLFVWTIFIVLLIGFTAACWMGSYYIFGHPEQAFSYSILNKLDKLEPPKRFAETAAPKGEFLDSHKLIERYNSMTPRELKHESDRLLRNYIRNYQNLNELVPYVIGRFNILDSYELTPNDFFDSGVVALAQSSDNPQVLIEHVFTADKRMIQTLHRSLLTGLDIPLKRTYDLSAAINVERLGDGRLKVTAIPLHYPGYSSTQGAGGFSLEPPATLNVEAGLPILSRARIADAEERYASYRRKLGIDQSTLFTSDEPAPPVNELVRVAPALPLTGEAPVLDDLPVARALPVDPAPEPTVTPVPADDPMILAAATPIPFDSPTPPPSVVPTPQTTPPPLEDVIAATPSPTPEAAPAVPLKPFNAPPAQTAAASTTGGAWETYAPGRFPKGRLVAPAETVNLAKTGGAPSERTYLQGDFVVSASSPTGAVLRPRSRLPLVGGGSSNVRIIVQFPSGSAPPDKDTTVSRNAQRPFLITDVKTAEDGQINVWVREITTE